MQAQANIGTKRTQSAAPGCPPATSIIIAGERGKQALGDGRAGKPEFRFYSDKSDDPRIKFPDPKAQLRNWFGNEGMEGVFELLKQRAFAHYGREGTTLRGMRMSLTSGCMGRPEISLELVTSKIYGKHRITSWDEFGYLRVDGDGKLSLEFLTALNAWEPSYRRIQEPLDGFAKPLKA